MVSIVFLPVIPRHYFSPNKYSILSYQICKRITSPSSRQYVAESHVQYLNSGIEIILEAGLLCEVFLLSINVATAVAKIKDTHSNTLITTSYQI